MDFEIFFFERTSVSFLSLAKTFCFVEQSQVEPLGGLLGATLTKLYGYTTQWSRELGSPRIRLSLTHYRIGSFASEQRLHL